MADQQVGLDDIEEFRRWAVGNLVDNLNRGVFAEWMVGLALGAIDRGDMRTEWDGWDLDYRGTRVEVKASGLSQGWALGRRSIPRFDIAPRKWFFRPDEGGLVESVPPARIADLYVFCLHVPVPATNENARDPSSWEFWVVSKQTLDDELGAQKTVGLATLGLLSAPCGWPGLKAAVDAIAPAN